MALMGHVKRIHFVGIGGAGMCGIAEVLQNSGYKVSGSDLSESNTTKHLQEIGIEVFIGHEARQCEAVDVVVQSTAVSLDNVEIIAAKQNNIPVIQRAEMLAELMRFKHGIAIAGTHGKTTTTSLLSCILAEAGLDPSYVIGGKLNSVGANAKLGQSDYFVAEADESDASFLFLKPLMAVVTNIDEDHMTTYNNDYQQLRQTFLDFLQQLPFYGLAVMCTDDSNVVDLLADLNRPIISYGFNEGADVRAINWQQKGLSSHFTVQRKNHSDLKMIFNLPGRHNVQNALAAIAIATELDVSDQDLQQSLASFQGVSRRFQMYGKVEFDGGSALLVDDYGHHPCEVSSTIDAIRNVWPDKRLVHVFQPHRYTRTKDLFNEFGASLSSSDEIILLDVFAAGETPIDGISSNSLAEIIKTKNQNVQVTNIENIKQTLELIIKDGDILLMQGAGSIGQAALKLSKPEIELC